MKLTLIAILLCLALISLNAVTIYEIQHTAVAGDGTYPSLLAGQNVTTQGIVTATGYSGDHGYYISMPEGGAWKGILIYDNDNSPSLGSLIEVSGQCWEYYGLTEIRNVTTYQVISVNNPIPPAAVITTAMASTEAYEGVLMEVQDATVTSELNQYGEWTVSDGSGDIVIADTFFDQAILGTLITLGANFTSIKGVGNYSYGTHNLNPRSQADIIINSEGVVISLPSLQVPTGPQFTVPVGVSNLTLTQGFQSYHFHIGFNPNVINYASYGSAGTLSSGGTITATTTTGSLEVSFTTNSILQGQGTLLNLNFTATADGVSPLTASSFTFNGIPVMIINQGLIIVGVSGGEVIDTLTVIQRPLLNMPAIVVPGEDFNIECIAPETTTNWAFQLQRGNLNAQVPVTNAVYQSSPAHWHITATVPNVSVFEMYDLKVTASGGINDKTRHSVQVLPTRKTNYYFAQVTDIHMPSHIFYPDTGYDTDSTETVDFREVIRDLNIIRPEFVLITGDFVNQGELEEFENMRVYSKAKRVLSELEIPCYLVSGNHDIGGWTGTPPPAGASRKFWWKNFGWSWLDNASVSYPYHTQDYSFDYGPVHFTGLESYDNYENYLYNIYGSNSFTPTQINWLQSDLTASDAATKVLFYHFDFNEELNLGTLDADMALWGHIHYDSGSTAAAPYNISTESVCDGNRAYRIVRVTGSTLQPYGSVFAGNSGNQIRITFTPENYGLADSVYAAVVNNQPLNFENAVVKFKMPAGDTDYTVTGGVLEQVDRSGAFNVCYVRVNLTLYATLPVTIKANTTSNQDNTTNPSPLVMNAIFPNPFRESASISINTAKAAALTLKVYNLKGEAVRTLFNGRKASGLHNFNWDGKDSEGRLCPAGMYIVKLSDGKASQSQKVVRLK
jgi:hypothetical protein